MDEKEFVIILFKLITVYKDNQTQIIRITGANLTKKKEC